MPALIDDFHRQLRVALEDKIVQSMEELANGSALSFDEYKERCGYIRSLRDTLDRCEEIERDMYGGKPPGEQQEQE